MDHLSGDGLGATWAVASEPRGLWLHQNEQLREHKGKDTVELRALDIMMIDQWSQGMSGVPTDRVVWMSECLVFTQQLLKSDGKNTESH